ncbi:Plant protein of unknown function (DUF247) [Abeliophyllum distichum]|uniref:Uncharacterized protein n=1 Tax=Abeliophyllum distichum TaxID=126358 RepID=A0ABD1VCD4_9LAMI
MKPKKLGGLGLPWDPPQLLPCIESSAREDVIPKSSNYWHLYPLVTELETAGIYFEASKTHHVTDVKFKSHHIFGTLMLPPIMVDDSTKPLLLNLVAYEISPHGPSDLRITSYIWLMDSLIDHAEDVKQLRKKGILLNNLGSDEQLAQLFNEIANDLVPDPRADADVKDLIEKHCKNKQRVWIAEWMHNHFSSPWTVLAFLGAIFAIALSLIQTYLVLENNMVMVNENLKLTFPTSQLSTLLLRP